MLEQGIAKFVQSDAAVSALSSGGFAVQLPKGQALPAWTHQIVSDPGSFNLAGVTPLSFCRIQIDCHGNSQAEAIKLARAIDAVLNGYSGNLPDVDSTEVQGCFRTMMHDQPFDEASRTFIRQLEYSLWFQDVAAEPSPVP